MTGVPPGADMLSGLVINLKVFIPTLTVIAAFFYWLHNWVSLPEAEERYDLKGIFLDVVSAMLFGVYVALVLHLTVRLPECYLVISWRGVEVVIP